MKFFCSCGLALLLVIVGGSATDIQDDPGSHGRMFPDHCCLAAVARSTAIEKRNGFDDYTFGRSLIHSAFDLTSDSNVEWEEDKWRKTVSNVQRLRSSLRRSMLLFEDPGLSEVEATTAEHERDTPPPPPPPTSAPPESEPTASSKSEPAEAPKSKPPAPSKSEPAEPPSTPPAPSPVPEEESPIAKTQSRPERKSEDYSDDLHAWLIVLIVILAAVSGSFSCCCLMCLCAFAKRRKKEEEEKEQEEELIQGA